MITLGDLNLDLFDEGYIGGNVIPIRKQLIKPDYFENIGRIITFENIGKITTIVVGGIIFVQLTRSLWKRFSQNR